MNLFEKFSVDRFISSLQYMWQGMLCIFVVIAVIILSVYLIGFLTSRSSKKKEKENQENNG